MLLQKKEPNTWKLASDSTTALSSSVIATKLSAVSDAWQVPASKHSNGLQALDSSAFRPPADIAAPPDTTSLYRPSSHSTAADMEDSTSSSDAFVVKKSHKRPRSPSGIDVASVAQSKFLTTSISQRLVGSTPSLTVVGGFPRNESVYNISRQHFSPVDNYRRVEEFSGHASLRPLYHEYQSSADGPRSGHLLGLAQQDVEGVQPAIPTTSDTLSNTTTNLTSQSSVTASPYLPFLTATSSSNISGLYYPNPYVMLSSPPSAYQQTPSHFAPGWMSSAVGCTGPTPSQVVADHMQQLDSQIRQQQLHRGAPTSAPFDFPWMRGNPLSPKATPQIRDLYENHLAAAAKQSFGFNQYIFMRNVSNLGAALASDGLDMYRQPTCDVPPSVGANRVLLDNYPSSYLGFYPPLFHPPYLGIPSR